MRSRIFFVASTLAASLVLAQSPTENSSNAQQAVTTSGGTAHAIPEFSSSHAIGNSTIYQTGGNVGIGTTSPTYKLDVSGDVNLSGSLRTSGSAVVRVFGTNLSSTAVGVGALPNDLSLPGVNTAVGSGALSTDFSGSGNVAVGDNALRFNDGFGNSAFGSQALTSNTSGGNNTALGSVTLDNNSTGCCNTAVGASALNRNTTGNYNIGIGFAAGLYLVGSYNIDIGNQGASTDSDVIRIGDPANQTSAYMAGVSGVNVAGNPVFVDSNGQLGVNLSSRRYKEAIEDIGDSSDALMRLRPVSFRYKNNPDGKEYGLIAEEVADVYPEVVVYNNGQPDAVQYHKINALLLNEVQKQHARIESLERDLAELEALVARQSK